MPQLCRSAWTCGLPCPGYVRFEPHARVDPGPGVRSHPIEREIDADADALGVDLSAWELNGNLILDIPAGGGAVAPYLGGGVNYSSRSVSSGSRSESFSDVGVNLLGGLRFASAGPSPFLEGRYTTESGEFEGRSWSPSA